MVLLPIAARELRTAARRKSTHRIRLYTPIVAASVILPIIFFAGILPRKTFNLGHILFTVLTWYAFGMSLLAGVFLASDCISEEKREGTLGLLFLTDLKGHDVVFGKLTAAGLNALYGLLAILPVAALPLLMGGVTGAEYWRVSLALVNTLFFAVVAGLLVSVFSRETNQAMGRTIAILLVVVGGGLCFSFLSSGMWYMASFSPMLSFEYGSAGMYVTWWRRYWISLGITNLFAWFMLLLAGWALPRVWQDKPRSRAQTATPSNAWNRPLPYVSNRPAERRARLLDINPVLWLSERTPGLGRMAWVVAVLWVILVSGALLIDASIWSVAAANSVMLFFGFILKILIALQASRFFAEGRRTGALELILSTPMTSREIISGQWLALRRKFLWPVIIFLATLLVLTIVEALGVSRPGYLSLSVNGSKPSVFGLGAGNFNRWFVWVEVLMRLYKVLGWATNFVALGWIGMWLGLSARKPNLAAAMTILFVAILPPLAFCVPGPAIDLFLIFWSRRKLIRLFRTAAMPHYHGTETMPGYAPPPTPLIVNRENNQGETMR